MNDIVMMGGVNLVGQALWTAFVTVSIAMVVIWRSNRVSVSVVNDTDFDLYVVSGERNVHKVVRPKTKKRHVLVPKNKVVSLVVDGEEVSSQIIRSGASGVKLIVSRDLETHRYYGIVSVVVS